MLRTFVATVASIALLARVSVAWTTIDGCEPIPLQCVPIKCCEASPRAEAPPKEPLPKPPAPPVEPSAAAVATPAANADSVKPLPLNQPTIEPAAEPAVPASRYRETPSAPAATTTPQPAAPAAEAPAPPATSRYSVPPATSPAATGEANLEDVFEDAPAASGPAPAAEAPPAETEAAPTATGIPVPAGTPTPAADDDPDSLPDEADLFGPTSLNLLQAPGGWESDRGRTWKRVDGQTLALGRVSAADAAGVVVTAGLGRSTQLRYAELSVADLSFLRGQIKARRQQLAHQPSGERLLATER
jgi:hypothetical protein